MTIARLLAFVFAIALVGQEAHAATIRQQVDYLHHGDVPTNVSCNGSTNESVQCGHRIDFNRSSMDPFEGFDFSLGTLTEVTFDTNISVQFATHYKNADDTPPFLPKTTVAEVGIRIEAEYFSGSFLSSSITLEQEECSACYLPWMTSFSGQVSYMNPTTLEGFQHVAEFSVFGTADVFVSGGGLLKNSFPFDPTIPDDIATGSIVATYHYTPVPEPSTALLLSLGLTGLAAKGRRSLRSCLADSAD